MKLSTFSRKEEKCYSLSGSGGICGCLKLAIHNALLRSSNPERACLHCGNRKDKQNKKTPINSALPWLRLKYYFFFCTNRGYFGFVAAFRWVYQDSLKHLLNKYLFRRTATGISMTLDKFEKKVLRICTDWCAH